MRMPVMDGMEATRGIRALPGGRETVILGLSASALEENRRAALDSGVDDFLSKPCTENELFQKVQMHLGFAYIFAEEKTQAGNEAARFGAAPGRDVCGKLPPNLIAELQQSVRKGNKDNLDQLIATVAGLDEPLARSLKQLADNFDYDALTHLLVETQA